MTQQDERWQTPPLGTSATPDTSPYSSWPPASGHLTGYGTPITSLARRPGRRQRLAPRVAAVIAATCALALALAGGAVIVDHNRTALPNPLPAAGGAQPPTTKAPTPKGSTAPEPVLSVQQVQARVSPGVVIITSQLGYLNAEAAGTGMLLTASGEILTNNHVIDGATSIDVTVVATGRHYVANVLGTSAENDVALLQLEQAQGLTPIPLGNSDTVATGQSVVALGNAGGTGSLSVVSGKVTSTDRTITAKDQNGTSSERLSGMIEVQAQIEAGDSGGPLASRAGKVIGMNTAASETRRQAGLPTFGFAIPINRAIAVAQAIRSSGTFAGGGVTGRGYLGISVTSGSGGAGAEVLSVTPGSPAEAAGLSAGDTITDVDNQLVTSGDGLTETLSRTKAGERVRVGWLDITGGSHHATVTLADHS